MRTRYVVLTATITGLLGMALQSLAEVPRGLPEPCKRVARFDPSMGGMHPGGSSDMGAAIGNADEAHRALAGGMAEMHMNMEIGMSATNIDVAFICGMIPHHLGAIDMAEAVIDYGSDPWVKELAAAIVAAQTTEVADMTAWLNRR